MHEPVRFNFVRTHQLRQVRPSIICEHGWPLTVVNSISIHPQKSVTLVIPQQVNVMHAITKQQLAAHKKKSVSRFQLK